MERGSMLVYEAIREYRDLLKALARNGIGASWARNIELYDDYTRLVNEGHKMTYITSYLAEVYNITVSQVYRIIGKMLDKWR